MPLAQERYAEMSAAETLILTRSLVLELSPASGRGTAHDTGPNNILVSIGLELQF